jgi:hypothetical protein
MSIWKQRDTATPSGCPRMTSSGERSSTSSSALWGAHPGHRMFATTTSGTRPLHGTMPGA